MRPPILWITVAFGAGLGAGGSGLGAWRSGVVVLAVAAVLARCAPLGAATGVMLVAGMLWGEAALRERAATCAGLWVVGQTRAAIVRLGDPAPGGGGGGGRGGGARSCGGAVAPRRAR